MKNRFERVRLAGLAAGALAAGAAGDVGRPNIVVILSDDQGYADISVNARHPKEVSTPHMDALAREGVFFTQAYTSSSVCSPTRAGLMLGRYQQRVGIYTGGEGGRGMDPAIPIFPSFLPPEYVSTALGKWHLGLDADYPDLKWHPVRRGFAESYNFMGRGGHDYFKLKGGTIYRNLERIDDEGYLTTRLTDEAVAFIDRNRTRPFFLYLAYNAVHAPPQAPKDTVADFKTRFPDLTEARAILMGMLHRLDLGVGAVVKKLKDENLWNNTLLFYFTDNGGSKAMQANNAPLRGFKGSHFEGGIRTPFIASWPERFAGGRAIDTPVISLDILPTVLDAIGRPPPAGVTFDGKSLLPLLAGATDDHHDALFWSDGGAGGTWAVRRGDWKLHSVRGAPELTNLHDDPSEQVNLAAAHPDKVRELTALYDAWLEAMAPPVTGGSKRWTPAPEPRERTEREKAREDRRKERRETKRKRI